MSNKIATLATLAIPTIAMLAKDEEAVSKVLDSHARAKLADHVRLMDAEYETLQVKRGVQKARIAADVARRTADIRARASVDSQIAAARVLANLSESDRAVLVNGAKVKREITAAARPPKASEASDAAAPVDSDAAASEAAIVGNA